MVSNMLNNKLDIIENNNIIGVRKDTPIDLNLIQSAIFNRNKNSTKIKEINLDNLDILIRSVKGHTIPNAFDEDVFFAIIHLFVKFKEIWRLEYIPRTIYLTYSDLCNVLKIGTQYIDRLRISLDKLASTSYKFINTFIYREISTNLVFCADFSHNEIKNISKESSVILYDGKVYGTLNIEQNKIKTIVIADTENQFKNIIKTFGISTNDQNEILTDIISNNPIIKSESKDKKLDHLLNIFSKYTISGIRIALEEDEFLSDIRNEVEGIKISDFQIKKNSSISTFNLINFVEYIIDDCNINDMLIGAKIDQINVKSVKSFLENKISNKSKYLLRIDLNNYMYENLINKVYLKHSLTYLLDFKDKTARALYLFMEGSKGVQKKKKKNIVRLSNPNIVIIDVELLAEYVGLSLDSKAISGTLNSLMRALDYLKSNGHIKNYIIHREKPLRYSYIKVEFYIEQNRNHPEYKPYSIKVICQDTNIDEFELENIDKFSKLPDEIKSCILKIPSISPENIDALITLYENNNKFITVKNKTLKSTLGELMIKAIVKKITTTIGIRSVSAYLYKTISTPKYYASELIEVKNHEYNELCKEQEIEKNKKEKNLIELKKESELEQRKLDISIIDNEWDNLPEQDKKEYIQESTRIINSKNIPESLHDKLPISIFALKKFNIIYDPYARFYI